MNIKVNEPVHIRTRKLSNGNETIYLDIIVDGKRKQEYLKLYLLQEPEQRDDEPCKCGQG